MHIPLVMMALLWAHQAFSVTIAEFVRLTPEQKANSFMTLSPEDQKTITNNTTKFLFEDKVCPGCYFENVVIEGKDLTGAILQNCVFKNCVFRNTNFTKATFDGSYIIDGAIENCDFTELNPNVTESSALGMIISGIQKPLFIKNCKFINAKLHQARLNADFLGCDCTQMQAVSTRIRDCKFDDYCKLVKANMQWLDAYDFRFGGDASQLDMRNALLLETDFSTAILTQAQLQDATVIYSRFNGAKMDGINLKGTNFVYAVSLRFANLAKAGLSDTVIFRDGPYLKGQPTRITPTNLSEATNFAGAYFCQTIMPDGTLRPNNDKENQACIRAAATGFTREGSTLEMAPCIGQRNAPCLDGTMDIVQYNTNKLIQTKQCPYCMLEGAKLQGKDLTGADLRGAWLRNANVKGTNFTNASLQRARMPGATVDRNTRFTGARLCHTLMPDRGENRPYAPGDNFRDDNCGQP